MAINDAAADACGNAILAAIDAMTVADRRDNPEKIWQNACRLIFQSIRLNAVVNVASVSGVSTGGGSSGPGSGSIT